MGMYLHANYFGWIWLAVFVCTVSSDPLSEVSIRLVNGDTPNEGRVEVKYDNRWGTVCSQYHYYYDDDTRWHLQEANVVCRQLGYLSASQAWSFAHFGEGSLPTALFDVDCDGHETSINQCRHDGWFMRNCNHHRDVGVTCNILPPKPVLVRLAGGATPHEGRVQLYYRCYWGILIDAYWTMEDANVICRQLGYPSASHAWGQSKFGRGEGPVVLALVRCHGNESSIQECDNSGPFVQSNYYYFNSVGVSCDNTSHALVRLVNSSSPYKGIVEVYYQDHWGTICDDSWNMEEANVICRQLGLPSPSRTWQSDRSESGPTLNISCSGSESNIGDCDQIEWVLSSCPSGQISGVTCGEERNNVTVPSVPVRLAGGSGPHEGIVEVFDTCGWALVSSSDWRSNEANVVCRQLGYPSASYFYHVYVWDGRLLNLFTVDDIVCRGDEERLDQCQFSKVQRNSLAAQVDCDVTNPPSVAVRLVDGNTPHEGRVEVSYKCFWVTICQSGWGIEDADVICRQLGYPSANRTQRYPRSGTGLVLYDVDCIGNESRIEQCNHNGWYRYCSRDAGVTCETAALTSALVRLVNGSNPYEGIVEVYYQDRWGTICDDSWSTEEASVICRQLGLSSPSRTWQRDRSESGPNLNISCSGSESNIDQCNHIEWLLSSCNHSQDAGVTCGEVETTSPPVTVRLIDGKVQNEGRVEVFYQCIWGTIYDGGRRWSIREAEVVCQQLGYPSASQVLYNAYFGTGSGPVLLHDVACTGNESSIEQCEHGGWFSRSYYSHYYDVGVSCNTETTIPPDVESPVINCPSNQTVQTDSGRDLATVSLPDVTSVTDNTREVTVIIDLEGSTEGRAFSVGEVVTLSLARSPHLLHYIALDESYNRASCDMYITVREPIIDVEPPDIQNCPDDVTIPVLPYSNHIQYDWTPPTITDNIGQVDVTFSCVATACYQSGSGLFEVGDTTVTYRAQDPSGNEDLCDFTVTVTVVSLTCPASISTLAAPGTIRTRVNWPEPVLTGWNGPTNFTASINPGDVFQIGTEEIKYKQRFERFDLNLECSFNVTVQVVSLTCPASISTLAAPGTIRTRVNWPEPVLTGWNGPTNFTASINPGDVFQIGTEEIKYKQRFERFDLNLECSFNVTVQGQCESETDADGFTWLATQAGSVAESVERCPLMTLNAGQPLAVRNCSLVGHPVYFQWEEPRPLTCGKEKMAVTLEDVKDVEVTQGNAMEVAEFLANQTSKSSDESRNVEAVSDILMNIANAGSGDAQVTKLVIETVNNVISQAEETPDASSDAGSSSVIVQSVERQVSLTLQQEGRVSIRQDTIHVEAVSLDPERAIDGFSFVSLRQSNQGPQNTLADSVVKTFEGEADIPSDNLILASARLPGSIAESLNPAVGNLSTKLQVSFLIYAADTLFQSASLKNQTKTNSSRKVAGPVVSLSVEGLDLVNLTEPVVLEFQAPINSTEEELNSTTCVFWDFALADGVGDWSTVGCILGKLTKKEISCHCSHATNFAILVDVKGQKPGNTPAERALDVISQVGGSLSVVALAITLIVYISIRKLRTGKSRQIFIHFCFSLFLLYLVFLAGIDNAVGSGGGCVFVAALLHYLTLTSMMWMAVEARNMYVSTVKVFPEDDTRYMVKACLTAWGLPLLLVAITLGVAVDHYNNEHYCFLEPGLVLYLALLVPIGLILIHNIVTFILVMRSLLKVKEASRSEQISKRLQNAVGISALMGLTWVFGFLAINEAAFVFQLIFCLANSLQGVIVFIMFCARREEVRSAVAPYIRRLYCNFDCNMTSLTGQQSYDLEEASRSVVTSQSTVHTTNVDVSVSENQQ